MDDDAPNPLEYDDYRIFLEDCRIQMGLTVREVSALAELPGETFFSLVITERRIPSRDHLERLGTLFRRTSEEVDWLVLKAEYDRCKHDKAMADDLKSSQLGMLETKLHVAEFRLSESRRGTPPDASSILKPGEFAPDMLAQHVARQHVAREVLVARGTPDGPPARFIGINQASDTQGITLTWEVLEQLLDELRAHSHLSGSTVPYALHLESFPLTRPFDGVAPTATSNTEGIPTVFRYTDAVTYLKNWLDSVGKTPSWLATQVGYNRSSMGRALKNGRISKQLGVSLRRHFIDSGEFSEAEGQYLLLLIEHQSPVRPSPHLREALNDLRESELATARRKHSAEVLGSWVCAAICDLPSCTAIGLDYAAIGAALEPPVSPQVAEEAVRRLRSVEMLRLGADKLLHSKPMPVWMQHTVAAGEVEAPFHAYQLTMLDQGMQRLQRMADRQNVPVGTRFQYTQLKLPRGREEEMLTLLDQRLQRIASALASRHTAGSVRVMQVNLHLFPTTPTGSTSGC